MLQFISMPILIAIFISILGLLLILEPQTLEKNSVEDKLMRKQFRSSKHKWQTTQLKSFYFCYLCHKLISGWFSSEVLQCKKCGIIVHKLCKYLKIRKPDCKYIIATNNTLSNPSFKFFHQWRQCSYNTSPTCCVCDELCVGFESYICIWCNRVRHGECSGNQTQCDFGPLRNMILEPTEIKCANVGNFATNAFTSLRKSKHKLKEKTSQGSSADQQQSNDISFQLKDRNKTPVIVIINKKSGGQTGNQFIKAFYQALNPLQVISILDQGLDKLKIFTKIPNLFFIIGGGDGTICSVMNYIKTVPGWEKHNPPAAVLPLGTGNDLSRSLGWGPGADEINPIDLIKHVKKCGRPQLLDRWSMKIIQNQEERDLTVYNYMGIGLDAKICKQFHQARQKYPQLFFSQFSNKLIYTQMGALDLFQGNKTPLHKLIKVKVDGKQIGIEDIQNLILLNIFHWGGGVTELWKQTKQFKKQSFSDGLIEVIGLSDVLHMGQVQIKMDDPYQLAQGRVIEIEGLEQNKVITLQVDGQPVEVMSPVKLQIRRKDQVNILATKASYSGKISQLLSEAVKEKIIDETQQEYMLELARKMAYSYSLRNESD